MRGLVSPTGLRYHFPHLIPIWTREEWVWKLCVHHRRKRRRRQTHTLVDWIPSTTGPIAVSFIMKLGNLIDWFVFFFALITWWLNFYSYLFIWWTPAFLFVVMDCESRRNSGSAYLLHVIFYTFFPISLDNGTCLCAHVFRIRSFYFYFLFFFLETHTMMDGQMLAVCE